MISDGFSNLLWFYGAEAEWWAQALVSQSRVSGIRFMKANNLIEQYTGELKLAQRNPQAIYPCDLGTRPPRTHLLVQALVWGLLPPCWVLSPSQCRETFWADRAAASAEASPSLALASGAPGDSNSPRHRINRLSTQTISVLLLQNVEHVKFC